MSTHDLPAEADWRVTSRKAACLRLPPPQRSRSEPPGHGGHDPGRHPDPYVIHAPPGANGVESLHAHVITPAMDREREQAFNVYRRDTQHTREVAERETERIFELSRLRDREPGVDLQPEMHLSMPDREIEFHGR